MRRGAIVQEMCREAFMHIAPCNRPLAAAGSALLPQKQNRGRERPRVGSREGELLS